LGIMADITKILDAAAAGDAAAAADLLPLVYDELRKLATARLAQEKPGQTLQATALVHEAYIRLVGNGEASGPEQSWDNRGHFFAAAAEAMRRLLIDRARQKHAEKRGGARKRIDIDAIDVATTAEPDQLLAIDEALAKLAGMTVDEAGKAIGISTATAYRHWNYARVWLHGELVANAES
jgi:RNA polymerase sigma factor (TIGR02999 family)